MKRSNTTRMLMVLAFGVVVYVLNLVCTPLFGMTMCQIISGIIILILFVGYISLSSKEGDERERLLHLQSDSAALYFVIAGLLAATIFYPHSQVAMVFWLVLALAVVGRIIAALYQRYL